MLKLIAHLLQRAAGRLASILYWMALDALENNVTFAAHIKLELHAIRQAFRWREMQSTCIESYYP